MREYGIEAVVHIIVYLVCILLAWWAFAAVNVSKFVHVRKVLQVRLLIIFLSIALGSLVANFLFRYFELTENVSFLFS